DGSNEYLYYWKENNDGTSSDGWQGITSTTSLTTMKGYAFKKTSTGDTTLSFTGTFNTGTIGSADNLTRTASAYKPGFNLVGNPYPSAIDWDAATGWTKTNIENNTLWFRSNGNFPSYNGNTHLATLSATQYIPSMQAFWVRVSEGNTNGTLAMTNDVRVHNSQAFWKTGKSFPRIRLTVNRNDFIDESVVVFIEDASDEFDMYDTEKMFASDNSYPQIYFAIPDDINLAIDALPELTNDLVIPLGFKTETEGQFTISASEFEDILPGTKIYFEDLQENNITNLREENYSFTSGIVFNTERFILHFIPEHNAVDGLTGDESGDGSASGIVENSDKFNIDIYSYNKNIYIRNNSDESLSGIVKVYNLQGVEELSKPLNSLSSIKISLNAMTGYYMVVLLNGHNVYKQKVFIK
ncbi:MAG: T9SS type A sorting domain-containing protein, partial [Chlorobi bacterium]|nr:T9SS type A sorting domain-containing protein [Chlorobiota bacterium]